MSEQSSLALASEQPQAEYRDIAGFPGYRVSDDGIVWTCKRRGGRTPFVFTNRWRSLRPCKGKHGHLSVTLYNGGKDKIKRLYVHRLVLEAFIGPCPAGMQCCHCDGNPPNNRVGNLRWDTPLANNLDKRKHGTMPAGEIHHAHKLTAVIVRKARQLRKEGHTYASIATATGSKESTIYAAVTRRHWDHLEEV